MVIFVLHELLPHECLSGKDVKMLLSKYDMNILCVFHECLLENISVGNGHIILRALVFCKLVGKNGRASRDLLKCSRLTQAPHKISEIIHFTNPRTDNDLKMEKSAI